MLSDMKAVTKSTDTWSVTYGLSDGRCLANVPGSTGREWDFPPQYTSVPCEDPSQGLFQEWAWDANASCDNDADGISQT